MTPEKIEYGIDPLVFQKSLGTLSTSRETERAREATPEKLIVGEAISQVARQGVTGVFERFGRPLPEALTRTDRGFPITVELGGKKGVYDPRGRPYDTGGVYNNFKLGDTLVRNAQGDIDASRASLGNAIDTFTNNQRESQGWKNEYTRISNDWSTFIQENSTSFQAGYNLLNNGQAQWVSDGSGTGIIARAPGSTIPQDTIDSFNQVNTVSNRYGTAYDSAYRNYRYLEESKGSDLSRIDYARNVMNNAENNYSFAQVNRYRWLFMREGENFTQKVEASKAGFEGIFGKKYTRDGIEENYYRSMDTLGAFMTKMQGGDILTEADFKKEVQLVGASLSPEEKMIFLSMLGANLNNLTYNWNIAKNGKHTTIRPSDSLRALANAYQTGEPVPAGVCSSIHVAISSIAEIWGTPAGTITVSSSGVGHVVSIIDIGGKKILSDYGKLYTASTMEELFDTYAKANQGVVMRNYITDASGEIIGHIETPLATAFRRQALSDTDMAKMLETGERSPDGIVVSLYNGERSLKGRYTFNNGVYIGGKYSEATLMRGIDAKTVALTLGKEWKDIDLGSGWKGQVFAEGHISKSRIVYDGEVGKGEPTVAQIQGGIRGKKTYEGGSDLYAGLGVRISGQGTHPKNDRYGSIPVIGTGTSGESEVSLIAGGNLRLSTDTRIGVKGSITTNQGINAQSINAQDLNPLQGKKYLTQSGEVGVEQRIGNGSGALKIGRTEGPLSKETTLGVGYSGTDVGASIENTRVHGTHIFGPTDQNIIKGKITGTFGSERNGEWFAQVEKGGIGGMQTKVGAKWVF